MPQEYRSFTEYWVRKFEEENPEKAMEIKNQVQRQALPAIVNNPSEPTKTQGYARLWTDSLRQCEEQADIDPVVAAAIETRKSLKLTQTRFARCLDISPRTLAEWEQGKRKPSGAARTLLVWVVANPEHLKIASRSLRR
ncbi:helix-turn-helix domain-containing protein [Nitrincola iocasae]|nr:helix-turn-helix domain-containing protein [Nitrincola iocasae]